MDPAGTHVRESLPVRSGSLDVGHCGSDLTDVRTGADGSCLTLFLQDGIPNRQGCSARLLREAGEVAHRASGVPEGAGAEGWMFAADQSKGLRRSFLAWHGVDRTDRPFRRMSSGAMLGTEPCPLRPLRGHLPRFAEEA
jgi:hypothetical protein